VIEKSKCVLIIVIVISTREDTYKKEGRKKGTINGMNYSLEAIIKGVKKLIDVGKKDHQRSKVAEVFESAPVLLVGQGDLV
jgi:hypothetical protein